MSLVCERRESLFFLDVREPCATDRLRKAALMLLGYARVSKGEDQSTAAQRRLLREAGAEKVYEEAVSGSRWDRPELTRLLDQLRPGDVVMVWKLDRLSRSLKDLLHLLERIETAGAGFRSLTESIDTTTAAGRMLMQMLALS
jgi:DNA invertase Pin-like site-specific DNA recombinase